MRWSQSEADILEARSSPTITTDVQGSCWFRIASVDAGRADGIAQYQLRELIDRGVVSIGMS